MKKIILLLHILLIINQFKASGQCLPAVSTFSINTPAFPVNGRHTFENAILNSAGELVGIGLIFSGIGNSIYFAKINQNGNLIGIPKVLSLSSGIIAISGTYLDYNNAFIAESFDVGGNPDGYIVTVNTESGEEKGILIIRLDQTGCIIWNQHLNGDHAGRGIFNNGSDSYCILARTTVGSDIITINGSGTICNHNLIDGISAENMIKLNPGVFGAAVWGVCGTVNVNFKDELSIALLDNNFNEINQKTDIFSTGIPQFNTFPSDIVAIDSNVYVIGSSDDFGWLMKLSSNTASFPNTPNTSNLNHQWTKQIDMTTVPSAFFHSTRLLDIKEKNNSIIIGGYYDGHSADIFSPRVLQFDMNGDLVQAKKFDITMNQSGILSSIINDNNNGLYLIGMKGEAPLNLIQKAWIAKCNDNLIIGNCECNLDDFPIISNSSGVFIGVENSTTSMGNCILSPLQITCLDELDTKQVCYQPPVSNDCTADFTSVSGCYSAQVTAMATGTAPFTYAWDAHCDGSINLTTQTGTLNFPLFGGNAGYPVCLTITDATGCTAVVEKVIQVVDQQPFFTQCPVDKSIVGTFNASGICTAVVTDIEAAASDICPPVNITYSLSGATTGSGSGTASGLTFNAGITNVVYKATDPAGEMVFCNFKVTVTCPPPSLDFFTKIYGDIANNVPHKIKAFDGYVYLAGQTVENGELLGTFSKFDPATGDVVWQIHLDMPSKITDFEYIPASMLGGSVGGFILVGNTEPFSGMVDGNSFVMRIIDGASPLVVPAFTKRFNMTGRETFKRIIRHPNPIDPLYPFYLAGEKNPSIMGSPTPPNAFDQTFLMNIDKDLNVKFYVEYDYNLLPGDDELSRTLFPRSSGTVVLGGNDVPENDGILVEVNGETGAEMGTYRFTTSTTPAKDIDLHDGLELPNGDIVVVGEDFTSHQAFISLLKPDFIPYATQVFPDLERFPEIGRDAQGRLYTVGRVKAGALAERQVINQISVNANGFTGFNSWYLEETMDVTWANSHISVTPVYDNIFYADARRNLALSSSFNNSNVLLGSFDLNMTSACKIDYSQMPVALPLISIAANTDFLPATPPAPVGFILAEALSYQCTEFCEIGECTPACSANSLIINTGYNPITNTLGTAGQYSSFWELTQSPDPGVSVPRPAYIVTPNGAWANQTQTAWISAYPIASLNSDNPAPMPSYNFQNCFCVCADETDVTISLSAMTDNNVGIDLVTQAGTFVGDILDITSITSSAFTAPWTASRMFTLQKGNYCINAGLRNLSGVAMGLNIKGTVMGGGLLNSECCGVSNFITGQKYIDVDCNGFKNPSETGAQGWTIQLKDPNGAIVASTTTDAFGFYTFQDVPAGIYTVMEVEQPGYTISQPAAGMYPVTINGYDVVGGLDFGNCPVNDCAVSISAIQDQQTCYKVNFDAFTPSGLGTAPFTYQWDFQCNGSVDATLKNPMFVYPVLPGITTYNVCVTVTDATGCTASATIPIFVQPDITPPTLNCPANRTVNTDPDQCCATLNLPATATDNCTPVTITYNLTGATTGTSPNQCFNLGTTEITATATDQSGNSATCTYTVLVQDGQNPMLECPQSQSVSVPWCDNGAVFNFDLPVVTDNCPLPAPINLTCNHQSGEFFPCGVTTITCSAQDVAGNVGACQFTVNVNCECASLSASTIECTANPKVYNFTATIANQTGGSGCTITLMENQANATILNFTPVWTGNNVTITGQISVTDPVPNPLELTAHLACECSFGAVGCDVAIGFVPPCCEEIQIIDREICAENDTALVALGNCDNLYDVQQVKWYISDTPCSSPSWKLVQVTTACEPLLLLPKYLTGDICVFAEVYCGNNPCKKLISNIATLNLCAVPACEMVISLFEHCYTGSMINNSPIVVSPSADCDFQIEWYDPTGVLVQIGGTVYQPPALSFTGSATDCYQDYTYQCKIITNCTTQTCTATIRLWNNDAPFGALSLNIPDTLSLCPGEDIELTYIKDCVEPTNAWIWLSGSTSPPTTPIIGAGSANSLYNSNRLYTDTWFGVESKNGTCPAKTTTKFIPVRSITSISSFTAEHDPLCNPNSVLMTVDFNAQTGCNYTIKWYRNGLLVNTSISMAAPVTYSYVGSSLGGNYYCTITNDCCTGRVKSQIVQLQQPCILTIAGKCYRCKDEMVELNGILENLPAGVTANWQWTTTDGVIVSGATAADVVVNAAGTYDLSVNLSNGCTKNASFSLIQCGPTTPVSEVPGLNDWSVAAIPNPTSGAIGLEWSEILPNNSKIIVVDVIGQPISSVEIPDGVLRLDMQISDLPQGLYLFQFMVEGKVLGVVKVVRQ